MAPRGIVEKSRLRPGPGGEVVQHLWGEEPPDEMLVREGPARFYVELRGTRKTGLFLDQRETRAALRGVARGEALNAFAYTGSLSVAAAQGGARVTTLDLARPALERARHNFGANSLSPDAHEWIQGDAFEELPALVRAGRKFDLVVLDPPAFATTKKRVFQAERHWKDLATHGARLLRPGGVLVASSPMAAFPAAALERALADGAARAGIPLAVFDVRSQPADHPVDPACPERRYLKVLFAARVEEEQAQITTSARAGGRSPAPARAPR
jgi:23S rRNA (cytosine1962-C5)-methyltransferase